MQGSSGDTENRLVATVGEGEGGRIRERSTDAYTLPCVKETARGNLLCDAGNTKMMLCDN